VSRLKDSFGFGLVLTLVFVGLRIFGSITWPWIWVVSPLWLPLAGVLLWLLALVLVVLGVVFVIKE